MSNITATRDIIIIAAVAYIAFKMRKPFETAADVVGEAAERARQTIAFYGGGGELRKARDYSQIGQTDTEVVTDVEKSWTEFMRNYLGRTAPTVPTPPTAADAITGEGLQESVQILPHTPAAYTPELTPDIEEMIFAPAPDRPPVQIFLPGSPPGESPGGSSPYSTMPSPVVTPIVPSVTELVSQPTHSPTPTIETQPLDSMTPEQAESEGYSYSGAAGWFR